MKKKRLIQSLNKDIQDSCDAKNNLFKISKNIFKIIDLLTKCLKNGNKLLCCGNGGSASDAQHLATELMIRLRPKLNRKPLPCITLAPDVTNITACGNDFNFEKIFERNFEALALKKDVLFVISTSGNSKNIINVLKLAKKKKVKSVALLGNKGGIAKKYADINLIVDSNITARIQESHIFLIHFILENIENNIFKNLK